MTELVKTSEQLAVLAELDQVFADRGMTYWLFGGWAVDFHIGRVTREHGDIDIAVWSGDRTRLTGLLLDRAWHHTPEPEEDGYTCFTREGVRLEVAFLARDAFGHVYTPLRDGRGEWPADSFGDSVARLHGVSAHLVSRDSLIADKSAIRADAETTAKDRADVASLRRQ
jgi:hypothetical protein